MSAFQRRLDLLDFIPRHPRKISSSRLLNLMQMNGYQKINMRTIQRDLTAIDALGFFGLCADKRSKPYGWSIDANWKKLNITFMDSNTALAFSTLEQLSESLLPASTQKQLSAYFNKANSLLAGEKSSLISHWKNSVAMISNSLPVVLPKADKEVLKIIKEALFNKKQISANLKRYLITKKAPVWKNYSHINPLGLIYQDGSPILLCSFGSMHTQVYRFPIAFIKDAKLDKASAVVPKDFDFELAKKSMQQPKKQGDNILLELLVKSDSLFILKGAKLSEDQTIEEIDGDNEHYLLKANAKMSQQLKVFLRSLGNSVEVISPQGLRDYFITLAKDMQSKYLT